MDDQNPDDKSLNKVTILATIQIYNAQIFLQGMTRNVMLFGVGDTARAAYNKY